MVYELNKLSLQHAAVMVNLLEHYQKIKSNDATKNLREQIEVGSKKHHKTSKVLAVIKGIRRNNKKIK